MTTTTPTPTCNSCDCIITPDLAPISSFGKKAGYCYPCAREALQAQAKATGSLGA